jgi:hypothetical protein
MDFRHRRKRTHKKKKQSRKTRRRRLQPVSKPPNALLNFSPISSPGPNSPTFSLSPNTPNTPITKRAKQLANLYPNRGTMIQRSSSFNNGLPEENFYSEFERLFPEKNGPSYH